MSRPDIKNFGLVLGDFPVVAVIVTKTPGVIGDLPADYERRHKFEESSNKATPGYTQIAIGLLGFEIPLTKTPTINYTRRKIVDFEK